MRERKKIGEVLVDLQVLTEAQVDQILAALRKRADHAKFGRVGREMGHLREEHILAALAVQLQMFPGIDQLSLNRLLDRLQAETEPPPRLSTVAPRRSRVAK
jgi:hypothetical protein